MTARQRHASLKLKCALHGALHGALRVAAWATISCVGLSSAVSYAKSDQADHSRSFEVSAECAKGATRVLIAAHLSPRDPKIKSPSVKGVKLDDDRAWLAAQVSEANRLFARLKVCFVLRRVGSLPARDGVMKTRSQRTALGGAKSAKGNQKERIKRGRVDLFIVNRLGDVDVPGAEIRGVHWRDPQDRTRRRWIILSRIARPKVLAHELGHYFDLPHSRYASSIMNKRPRAKPPMRERGFVSAEYAKMSAAWKRMRGSGHLKPLE